MHTTDYAHWSVNIFKVAVNIFKNKTRMLNYDIYLYMNRLIKVHFPPKKNIMKEDNGTSKASREWRQLHILIEALRKSCMKNYLIKGKTIQLEIPNFLVYQVILST